MVDLFQVRKEIANLVELLIRFQEDVFRKRINSRHLIKDGNQLDLCKIRRPLIRQDQHSLEVMEKLPNLLIMRLYMKNGALLIERPTWSQTIDLNQTLTKLHQ